jgi:hypothetical protein
VPFGGYGFGYGGGYGYPVAVGGGGGGLGNLFVAGLFAFVAVTIVSSLVNNRADEGEGGVSSSSGGRVTVAKLQVGLLGSARSLQRDLDRIAGKADTSTPGGLHFVLQGKRGSGRKVAPPARAHQIRRLARGGIYFSQGSRFLHPSQAAPRERPSWLGSVSA